MGKVRIVDCHRALPIVARTYDDLGTLTAETVLTYEKGWQNLVTTGDHSGYWKDLILRGLDATTQLTAQKMTFFSRPMYVNWGNFGGGRTEITGHWHLYGQADIGLETPLDYLYDEAQSRAEMEFVKQVRAARTKWEAGEFLGEIAQTARFLAHPLKSLQGATINAGRKISDIAAKLAAYDKKSDLLQRATDSYLAYQFGVKPLISDIHGAKKALDAAARGHQSYEVKRLIGTGKAEQGSSDVLGMSPVPGAHTNPAVFKNVSQSRIATVRILGGYSVGLDRSPEMGFLDQFGVAPDNWVPTAYELFPWSHVVDYFTNVGSVLDAFSLGSVKFNWLLQTNVYDRVLTIALTGTESNPWGPNTAYGGQTILVQHNVSRRGRSNSFSPQFLVKKPSLSQSLNIAAMVNTIGMLKRRAGN